MLAFLTFIVLEVPVVSITCSELFSVQLVWKISSWGEYYVHIPVRGREESKWFRAGWDGDKNCSFAHTCLER